MKSAHPSRRIVHAWSIVLMASVGCAASGMMRAANDGDRPTLARAVAAAEVRGKLSLSQSAELAHTVVEHDLRSAVTPEDAMARLRDVRACAFEVDDVLSDRMKVGDSVGGEAALLRAESGALGEQAAREHVSDVDEHWRAVGMWGMTRDEDRDVRLRGLRDGSLLVRRAALHAVIRHDDPADFDAVLEVARLDPSPIVRGTAVRALARMAGTPSDIANRLRDLWTIGDEGLREDIAMVFASASVWAKGGREALLHLLSVSRGNEAVSVAFAILGASAFDPNLRDVAIAQLALALTEGGHRARIHAIAVVPLGQTRFPEAGAKVLLEALRTASRSEDLDVRLAALGRLADAHGGAPRDEQRAAIRSLEEIAAPTATTEARASRARLLLAEAGDLRVQSWIEGDLRSPDEAARFSAADALAALGRASRAAPLLADDRATVRSRAGCTIMLAARLR